MPWITINTVTNNVPMEVTPSSDPLHPTEVGINFTVAGQYTLAYENAQVKCTVTCATTMGSSVGPTAVGSSWTLDLEDVHETPDGLSSRLKAILYDVDGTTVLDFDGPYYIKVTN